MSSRQSPNQFSFHGGPDLWQTGSMNGFPSASSLQRGWLWILLLGWSCDELTFGAEALTFEQHVRPIFKAACFHCHGEANETEGGLDLRLVRLMSVGGESGPALVPGDVEKSLLWQQLASDDMPKGETKLSEEQKAVVKQWIKQGAKTARPEPVNVEDARFTVEELNHWAFQTAQSPAVPVLDHDESATPIDGFVAQRLKAEGLTFSPKAEPHTLIRRLTIDLGGLPPTSEDLLAFETDHSSRAYQRLVDRLLASPQFGVRWGRHWLDVAGYAETDGGSAETEHKREHAWRYRDYVMQAFNANKPIDSFIQEQLAGDEMVVSPLEVNNARQRELLTATGFLRMAPDGTQSTNTLTDRNTAVADAVQVVSASVLGLTIGCAQCHDHKYDPIGIDDYYRFRAVFDPAFPMQHWKQPNERLIDLTTADVKAEADRIEAEAKLMDDAWNARRAARAEEIQQSKLADVPDAVREATRTAVLTKGDDRTEQQRNLLDRYPMVKPISSILGLLVEYDGPSYRKFEKEKEAITALRATKPPMRMIMATTEQPNVVPTSQVFFRGSPQSPGEVVSPAELMVLQRATGEVNLPDNDPKRPTTGRRLAYARHLTNGRHPLTARVFVNRLWLHHFGRGLVSTPSDFGLGGERPSHPALLDWLATDFVNHDWDQKRLHRMMLLSRTYQQQSRRRPELDVIDPDNTLLARANLRRFEAETVRDVILAVSGKLDREHGGPSIPVTENGEGKVVIGVQKIRDGLPVGADEEQSGAYRRSAFVEVQRRLPLNMLATFDQPSMVPNCNLRRPTTVATQALWFLNDQLIMQRSEDLAKQVASRWASRREQVRDLFLRLFSETPTTTELASAAAYLEKQTQYFASVEDPETTALASFCQILLASNRFLYID